MTNNYLPTPYQSFIHKSRYSRWVPEEGRREEFGETVERLIVFLEGSFEVIEDEK